MGAKFSITYPRHRAVRTCVRLVGRLILPLAFRIRIRGQENFPKGGPLLVVGNHAAAMEAVMMVVYPPWQVEILGSVDLPHEWITQTASDLYKVIPVNRGHFDRAALVKSLEVLQQGGILAVFPEGGIWDAGRMRAQTGVAWLSQRASAPVLPIGFGGTTGALGAALRLKRPRLTMTVGRLIPPARLPEGQSRKGHLRAYAADVVAAIWRLIPVDDVSRRPTVADETFELRAVAEAADGRPRAYPGDLCGECSGELARLLHCPGILKLFTTNLKLPTQPLQNLHRERDPSKIAEAVEAVLDYLDEDNRYMLTYRFGPKEARAMRVGLEELLKLASWASDARLQLKLTPIRRYTSLSGKEIVQVKQEPFESWM
ncbi:MAG: lysophospholipid acyltransferase family protein [Anaerolineae bacterium]